MQKVIQHATRNISFNVEDEKSFTKADEQLIEAYIKLHDNEAKLEQQSNRLFKKAVAFNKTITTVFKALDEVKKEIAGIIEQADDISLADIKLRRKADALAEQKNKVYETISKYTIAIHKQHPAVNNLAASVKALCEAVENNELWDAYAEIKHSHFSDYDNVAIDIVSFEHDDDSFKNFAEYSKQNINAHIDFANAAIENYNKLVQQTEAQFSLWDEFLKRLVLIVEIATEKSGVAVIRLN